tara:strand:+ start:146 stop:1468 length:1323 start_codon:yes stop_codon:yes gene_type:complete
MYTGPKLTNDNLVFGYDTGYGVADKANATRFYPGEPTFNWIDHQNAVAQDSYTAWTGPNSGNWVANHPDAITAVNSLGNSITGYYNGGVGDATNTHHAHWVYDEILKKPVVQMRDFDAQWKAKNFGVGKTPTQMSLGHGGSYTISWLQWSDTVGKGADVGLYQSGFHDGRSYSSTTQTTAYKWERKSFSVSSHSTNYNLGSNVSIYMYGHTTPPNTSGVVKIADVQLEIKPHATPFADDTRSDTASLIDLKKTTDIDVGDVSFDSTGQPTFDGTDDKIVMAAGSYPTIGTSDFTVDVVFKNTKTSSYSQIFSVKDQYHFSIKMQNTGDRTIYVYRTSGLTTYGTVTIQAPSSTDYYHLVCKREGDNLELYLNGVSKGTKSGWNNIDIENDTYTTSIGTHTSSGSEFLAGEIPVVRVYNRALTSGEVLQNYKALKNRFDIQ